MAVSSTSNTNSTISIDVAGIVEGLMKIENKPLETLQAKITTKETVISDLGTIKSKVATFQDALDELEDPSNFENTTSSSTDSSVIQVSSTSGALLGSYTITDVVMATATKTFLTGSISAGSTTKFSSSLSTVTLPDSANGFTIQIGSLGTIYKSIGSPNGESVLSATPTITDIADWVNSLGIDASASVVAVNTDETEWALIIRGTETGSDYDVITNLDASSSFAVTNVNAADAEFTLDGINYTRSSNSINDVIDGVTFQLMSDDDSVSGTTISVMQGTDNSQTIIEDLITAYNDLIDTYKTLTANSYNSDSGETGTFANNPTMLYFVNEIKSRFAAGIVYGTDATDTISLGEMGIYLSEDGVASFDSADFESAQADGLQSKLAEGAYMGYNDSDDYLNYYITELIGSTGSGGIFADIVVNEQEAVDDLYDKEDTLQDRLTSIQNNYITQYSALNALLYQLSVTSNSLTSALDALSNNNNN